MSAEHDNSSVDTLLTPLRWEADQLITNPFGERVWLKESFLDGKRTGITDCCEAEYPCDWHQQIAKTTSTPSNRIQ